MLIGKVMGTLTPSIIYPGLEGVPMLLVQPLDKYQDPQGQVIVACDSTRMAAPQELVYFEGGREAALALEKWFVPVDHTIIGIVDDIHLIEKETP
jgi:ethanolamine utilization protein EutN